MSLASDIITGLVAAIHLYIMWLEMFAWTTRAKKAFRKFPPAYFETTKVLAANQGLYNGFLAAGLLWSFVIHDPVMAVQVRIFFLACVLMAGLYGGMTADTKIYFIQAIPAVLGIGATYLI